MSKNIFKILEKEDSDGEAATANNKKEVKPSEKQVRATMRQQREVYNTSNLKEERPVKKTERPPKDDYRPGEKRPYERHSGTGRQAFGVEPKKHGFGKGNVGRNGEGDFFPKARNLVQTNEKFEAKKHTNDEVDTTVVAIPKPEPVEEIMTLDAYQKTSGVSFGIAQNETRSSTTPIVADPDLKPIQSKKSLDKEVHVPRKKRNLDILISSNTNSL